MKFTSFLIAACVETDYGVERLADEGVPLGQHKSMGGNPSDVFWTLYGYKPDEKSDLSLATAISNCDSLDAALTMYEDLTGLQRPAVLFGGTTYLNLPAPAEVK